MQPHPKRELSPQQARVMAFVAKGMSRRQIASEMAISINTVKSYLYDAYHRMGVRNAPEAVAELTRSGQEHMHNKG